MMIVSSNRRLSIACSSSHIRMQCPPIKHWRAAVCPPQRAFNMRGSEICKIWFEDMDSGFGFDTPCHVYDKGGGFNWRPSGEGTPPPFNLCSAYSFRSAKGSMQSEAGDCMRTKSWRLALQGIVPKWCCFAYKVGNRNMCCMIFRFWSTECGEHFCTKLGQMRCKKLEISLRSHAMKQTMLNVASAKRL